MSLVPRTIEDLLASPHSKFTTFAANDCRFSGSFTDIFVNAVHPLLLKYMSEESIDENPNWHQAMNGLNAY